MQANDRRWTDLLVEEDLAFLKRFLLASGSLKDLAQAYGVSYPTIRLRLDRLIEKVKVLENQEIQSDFERLVRVLFAQGSLDGATMKALLAAHERELEVRNEGTSVTP
jgi:hypothetical protein